MKNYIILLAIFILATQSEAFANAAKTGWRPSFIFGYGITHADQTQTIHLADTPPPGLDNRYVGSSRLYGTTLFGFAIEKQHETTLRNTIGSTGLELDYLRNNSVSGTVLPMVNVSPNFDVLKYSYDIHSLVFQLTGKLTRQAIFQQLGGYAQVGLGVSVNRLSHYREYPPGDSTAAPMLSPFGNQDNASPAFSAGVGVTWQSGNNNPEFSFGYRYFYAGRSKLASSSSQQTNASFTLSPVSYHLLTLTMTV